MRLGFLSRSAAVGDIAVMPFHPLLLQNKNSEFCAPLTSFDWNETDPKRLGTSSIDTTCTIWDIEAREFQLQASASCLNLWILRWEGSFWCLLRDRCPARTSVTTRLVGFLTRSYRTAQQRGVVDTQLIAHDKEVYDIAWGGVGVFASVSADGSVRVFDLR